MAHEVIRQAIANKPSWWAGYEDASAEVVTDDTLTAIEMARSAQLIDIPRPDGSTYDLEFKVTRRARPTVEFHGVEYEAEEGEETYHLWRGPVPNDPRPDYLGQVGDGFAVLQPRTAAGLFDTLIGTGNWYMASAALLRGGRYYLCAGLRDGFSVGGDAYRQFFTLTDDPGNSGVSLVGHNLRVECANTMARALGEGEDNGSLMSFAHAEGIEDLVGWSIDLQAAITEQIQHTKQMLAHFQRVRYADADLEAVTGEMFRHELREPGIVRNVHGAGAAEKMMKLWEDYLIVKQTRDESGVEALTPNEMDILLRMEQDSEEGRELRVAKKYAAAWERHAAALARVERKRARFEELVSAYDTHFSQQDTGWAGSAYSLFNAVTHMGSHEGKIIKGYTSSLLTGPRQQQTQRGVEALVKVTK